MSNVTYDLGLRVTELENVVARIAAVVFLDSVADTEEKINRITELERENLGLRNLVDHLRGRVDTLDAGEKGKAATLQVEVNHLVTRVDDLENALADAEASIEYYQSEYHDAEEYSSRIESDRDELQSQLDNLRDTIRSL